MNSLTELKIVLREEDIPFFSDFELEFYLQENKGDYSATAYQCLTIKAENTTLNISGLSAADTSENTAAARCFSHAPLTVKTAHYTN